MTRETKIGMLMVMLLVGVFGFLVYKRINQPNQAAAAPEQLAGGGPSTTDQDSSGLPDDDIENPFGSTPPVVSIAGNSTGTQGPSTSSAEASSTGSTGTNGSTGTTDSTGATVSTASNGTTNSFATENDSFDPFATEAVTTVASSSGQSRADALNGPGGTATSNNPFASSETVEADPFGATAEPASSAAPGVNGSDQITDSPAVATNPGSSIEPDPFAVSGDEPGVTQDSGNSLHSGQAPPVAMSPSNDSFDFAQGEAGPTDTSPADTNPADSSPIDSMDANAPVVAEVEAGVPVANPNEMAPPAGLTTFPGQGNSAGADPFDEELASSEGSSSGLNTNDTPQTVDSGTAGLDAEYPVASAPASLAQPAATADPFDAPAETTSARSEQASSPAVESSPDSFAQGAAPEQMDSFATSDSEPQPRDGVPTSPGRTAAPALLAQNDPFDAEEPFPQAADDVPVTTSAPSIPQSEDADFLETEPLAGTETSAAPAPNAPRRQPEFQPQSQPNQDPRLSGFESVAIPDVRAATTPVVDDGFSEIAGGVAPLAPAATLPAGDQYVIQPNDNFWLISRKKYGTGRYFQALARHNAAIIPDVNKMRPGTVIATPPGNQLERLYAALVPKPVAAEVIAQIPAQVSPQPKPVAGPAGYFVSRDGQPMYRIGEADTLSGIALQTLGRSSRWVQVWEMNRDVLKDGNSLTIGTVLRLPADASQVQLVGREQVIR